MSCEIGKCIRMNEYEYRCESCCHYIPSWIERRGKCQFGKLKAAINTEQRERPIPQESKLSSREEQLEHRRQGERRNEVFI